MPQETWERPERERDEDWETLIALCARRTDIVTPWAPHGAKKSRRRRDTLSLWVMSSLALLVMTWSWIARMALVSDLIHATWEHYHVITKLVEREEANIILSKLQIFSLWAESYMSCYTRVLGSRAFISTTNSAWMSQNIKMELKVNFLAAFQTTIISSSEKSLAKN